MSNTTIKHSAALLCGAALLATSLASSAGSPPPPPWNPTKTIKLYFVLNDDLRASHHMCKRPPLTTRGCTTGAQLVQRKLDYLNGVFEFSRVNLRAVSVGIWEHPGGALLDPMRNLNRENYPLVEARRKSHGAEMAILIQTHAVSGYPGGGGSSTFAWFAMTTPASHWSWNANQLFAHELGHSLGAGHSPTDGGHWYGKPYAVGYAVGGISDLMGEGKLGRVDHYSDHESRMGNMNQSVGRALREKYGRYSRYTGTAPVPDRKPPCCGISGGR